MGWFPQELDFLFVNQRITNIFSHKDKKELNYPQTPLPVSKGPLLMLLQGITPTLLHETAGKREAAWPKALQGWEF